MWKRGKIAANGKQQWVVIGTASAAKQLDGREDAPVEVQLSEASPIEFVVQAHDGQPLAEAVIHPLNYLAGSYELVPEAVCEVLCEETNADGRVKFESLDPAKLFSVNVVSDDYGTQSFTQLVSRSQTAGGSTKHVVRLSPVGALTLKLTGGSPQDYAPRLCKSTA